MGGKSSRPPELPLYKDLQEVKINHVWTIKGKIKDGWRTNSKKQSCAGLESKIFPEENQSNPDKPQFRLCLENADEERYMQLGFKHRITLKISLTKLGNWQPPPPHCAYISKVSVLDANGVEFPEHYESRGKKKEKVGRNSCTEIFRFGLDVVDSDPENAKIRISKLNIACQIIWFEKLPPTDLECDIVNLLESGQFSDIKLTCSGTSFKCHRLILAARSSVFATMFQNDMKETNENKVEIKDMEPEVLKELLNFIYSGNCNAKESTANLLIAADMYDLQALRKKCEYELADNLSMDNALEAVSLAKKLDLPYLQEKLETCFPSP